MVFAVGKSSLSGGCRYLRFDCILKIVINCCQYFYISGQIYKKGKRTTNDGME